MDIVNVINMPNRKQRLLDFTEQAKEQGFEFRVWEGIHDRAAIFRGISMAHNQPIIHAKALGLERCFIAEDDCIFLGVGAWDYFLSTIPESYDLALSMVYEGEIDGNNRIVKNPLSFSGLTLYCVHSRFYDAFLNINTLAHKDRELGKFADKYEYYVCNPFTTKQSNGYSDNKKQYCEYDHLLKGRKLFGK